jgi:phage-related tail protein
MTRRQWTLIVIAYAILAGGFITATIWLSNQQDDLDHKTDQIERNQRAIAAVNYSLGQTQAQLASQQADLVRLLRNTAAATCLLALAPEKEETAAVKRFNRTGVIDIRGDPTCRKAVKKAAKLILEGGP